MMLPTDTDLVAVLRNRRARLVEQGQIAAITRSVALQPFAPHWLETEASDAVERLLRTASDTCRDETGRTYLDALARVMWQSQASSGCLLDLLLRLQKAKASTLNASGFEFLSIGSAVGYSDWGLYRGLLCRAVRAHLPDAELLAAVAAARAWAAAGIDASYRIRRVVDLVTSFSGLKPKLLLFAGYPGLAEELRVHLANAFGHDAVVAFLAEQSMEEKETCALRFQQDPDVWLLASDESGGEGRNFQFASALVHVDTPWHAARVEQRVGRLDRLGRERVSAEVRSYVIYNDGSVESGLVRHLDQALGVYRRSISGLEFALRDVEQRILATALNGGLEALVEAIPDVSRLVDEERTRDETEAVLDEASYEASTAARFRAIARSERTEAGIERATYEYMRQLTDARGARRLDTAHGPGAVIRFQPERTCYGALPIDGTGAEFLAGNFDGTFRRAVAQQAPSLRFFSVSDPLFNAIIGSLDRQATGRTFGIELLSPGRGPWVGVECRFVPRLQTTALDGSAGLLNRLDALFIPKPVGVLIDLQGTVLSEPDADAMVNLRRRAEYATRGQTWWDLAEVSGAVGGVLDADNWPDTVNALLKIARVEAHRRIAQDLDAAIKAERRRMDSAIAVLTDAARRGDGDAARRAEQYAAFASALTAWQIDLDAVGLVSVNQRLRAGRPI
jgi:ATP-dependent helicase HepA